MKRIQILEKLVYETYLRTRKNFTYLRTRNYRRKFIENLLPKKTHKNMQIKQPRFKLQLN